MSPSRSMLVALVAALAVTGAYAGRGASMRNLQGAAAASGTNTAEDLQAKYHSQVDELSDMVSTVFLAHSGSNLQEFGLNVSAVVLAAEMSLQSFFTQVENFITGTATFIKTLPEEIAGIPGDVAETLDPANQPDPKQLANSTYLMEQFQTLVSGLEKPLALLTGETVFSYAPCFVNLDPGAVEVAATGANIAPAFAVITPEGVNIQPQGLNIQPVLVTIFPVGVNVQPQGLNIAPALIAVTPGRVSINPQGGTIGPALISVSAAAP